MNNQPTKLRGVIVGTGRAGIELHFSAFSLCGATIVAFVDIDLGRAQAAAKECGVAGAYVSLEEALKKERPDFISICSPPGLHYEHARTGLLNGAHVLVEKPFTNTMEEAYELKRLAEEKKLHVSVIHNRRFTSSVRQAIELYRSGALGRIVHIERHMHSFYKTVRMMEPEHWAQKIPGGRLFEANPHNLYQLYPFMGPMKLVRIKGCNHSKQWPHVPVDTITASLEGRDGATAQVTMSLGLETSPLQTSPAQYMIITGTKATIFVDTVSCVPFEQMITKGARTAPELSFKKTVKQLLKHVSRKAKSLLGKSGKPAAKGPKLNTEHKPQVEQFLAFISGRTTTPPVEWEEIMETQRMNDEMGRALVKG